MIGTFLFMAISVKAGESLIKIEPQRHLSSGVFIRESPEEAVLFARTTQIIFQVQAEFTVREEVDHVQAKKMCESTGKRPLLCPILKHLLDYEERTALTIDLFLNAMTDEPKPVMNYLVTLPSYQEFVDNMANNLATSQLEQGT